jgi:hypothetical protein
MLQVGVTRMEEEEEEEEEEDSCPSLVDLMMLSVSQITNVE